MTHGNTHYEWAAACGSNYETLCASLMCGTIACHLVVADPITWCVVCQCVGGERCMQQKTGGGCGGVLVVWVVVTGGVSKKIGLGLALRIYSHMEVVGSFLLGHTRTHMKWGGSRGEDNKTIPASAIPHRDQISTI